MKLGILGGGPAGRLLALSAHRLGLQPLVVDPKPDCPATAVAPTLSAALDDPDALEALARGDAVTSTLEAPPTVALRRLAERVCVRPQPEALIRTSDRLVEKLMLRSLGIATPRFCAVGSQAELREAAAEIGLPAVLRPRRTLQDGRGPRLLARAEDLEAAWQELGDSPLVLEALLDSDRVISLTAVRSQSGSVGFWAPTESHYADFVLRICRAPAPAVRPSSLRRAKEAVTAVLEELHYVGVLTLDFSVQGDEWVADRVSCRVHASGNWTLEGAVTSHYQNHLRAVAGLPLGSTRCLEPCATVALVGQQPALEGVLATPGARVHLHGRAPGAGGELGHVTISAPTPVELLRGLETLVRRLDDAELSAVLERLL